MHICTFMRPKKGAQFLASDGWMAGRTFGPGWIAPSMRYSTPPAAS